MKRLAPVVIFVYNRLEHTKNLLQSLEQCRLVADTELYIYADAPAHQAHSRNKVNAVLEYLEQYNKDSPFKRVSIIKAKQHKGLAESVIAGVSEVIEKYKNVIVLEDDLIVSRDFLEYMNEALVYYKNDKKIWSISGYTPPISILGGGQYTQDVFMGYRGHSWGYATWLDRWKQVDWEVKDFKFFQYNIFAKNKFNRGGNDLSTMLCIQMRGEDGIDSWAIRWWYAQSKYNTLTVYPRETRVKNCGCDGTGTHCGVQKKYDVDLKSDYMKCVFIPTEVNRVFNRAYKYFMAPTYRDIFIKYLRKKLNCSI